MKLSKQDADLFFKLMWSLQNYVNLKLGIRPDITQIDEYQKLPSEEKLLIRNALYDNIELIDSYLEGNSQDLSEDEFEIIKSWKSYQRGDFFIERQLKKYAIFIQSEKVYGVLALYESFADILPYIQLPYLAKAVLLPFKGKIIYDGLLEGYAISFGRGIRHDLQETYLAAKQNGRITISLDPQEQVSEKVRLKKPVQDWGPTLDAIMLDAKKLRTSSGAPVIQSPAFKLVRASLEFAKLALDKPDHHDELWKALEKVERAIRNVETTIYRAEYFPPD